MATRATYADLEIRILERQPPGYPVELTLTDVQSGPQEFPRGYLAPDTLPWVPTASPAEDGERLFRWLLSAAPLSAAWSEIRGRRPLRRVRLRIDAAVPELHAIPWELLREPGGDGPTQALAAQDATPFSRYLAGRMLPGHPILQRPVKILVVIANPDGLAEFGLPDISVPDEWASLQAATRGLEAGLTLLEPPCTLAAIEAELRKGYHIMHFIGHGSYSSSEARSVLFLADPAGKVCVTGEEQIAEMLARQLADAATADDDRLRLVFLASCQTATRSPADAFRGLAPRLVAAGVPAVLAMQELVPVATARQFATTFYSGLLEHGQVDLASNTARSAVLSAGLAGASIPVLFMRLPAGELLGQRGHITSDNEDMFWPYLLGNIDRGQCTPFLGPRAVAGLLPSSEAMAKRLADQYEYSLPDSQNLARVAQLIGINDPDLLRRDYLRFLQRSLFGFLGVKPTPEQKAQLRDASLTQTAEALNWSERVLALRENELHHLLAGLPFGLYMTTNVDSFMYEALKHAGRPARRVGLRWQKPDAGHTQWVLTPPPSPRDPVVLHLNGYDGDPEQERHLVLSEDDYLGHFVRVARDQEDVLPMNALQMLAEHSFLFLGYQLDDWEFRMLLQGLIRPIAQNTAKVHVGVQLQIEGAEHAEKAVDYLRRYWHHFHIDIYWGTPQQFVTELHSRWQAYLKEADTSW